MSHPKEWNEEEDNFDLTLSQRTEELYRIPNRETDTDGMIEAAVLPLRDLIIFPGSKSAADDRERRRGHHQVHQRVAHHSADHRNRDPWGSQKLPPGAGAGTVGGGWRRPIGLSRNANSQTPTTFSAAAAT